MKQRVTIIGPNLHNQSKGQFHVHAEGCLDVTRDPHRYGYRYAEPHMIAEVESKEQVVTFVYDDIMAEHEGDGSKWATPEAYFDEFNFAPCVKLPKYTEEEANTSG